MKQKERATYSKKCMYKSPLEYVRFRANLPATEQTIEICTLLLEHSAAPKIMLM